MRDRREQQISILLTTIAIFLWGHSILFARLEIGYFGLIHGLPVTFFVALAFLTVAAAILWMSSQDHGKLLCLQLLLLIGALSLIPLLTGGSHPNTDEQYRNFGYTEYIIRNGSLAPASVWYHNWPAAWLLFAAGFEILGVSNLEAIFPIFPLLIQLLCLLPLYVFLALVLSFEP